MINLHSRSVHKLFISDDAGILIAGSNGCKAITWDNQGLGGAGPFERLVVDFEDGRQQVFVAMGVQGWEYAA